MPQFLYRIRPTRVDMLTEPTPEEDLKNLTDRDAFSSREER